jgi:hypothetical protein
MERKENMRKIKREREKKPDSDWTTTIVIIFFHFTMS